MLLSTRGIVLRSIKYSESSLITDIFTEGKGLQSFIISGVRKGKSKVGPALLQVTGLVDLVAYFNESKDLHRIKEIKSAYPYQSLLFDIRRSSVGMFLAEVCRRAIQKGEENPAMFEYIFQSFVHLDQTSESISNFHLNFLINLSGFLGFAPYGSYSEESPFFDLREGSFVAAQPFHNDCLNKTDSLLLADLLGQEKDNFWDFKISKSDRKNLVEHLLDYYKIHLDHFKEINSHKILEEVLS
jgi:DNA repair protein RecO (recombination protein O)